jgi:hypothetical protein
MNVRTLVAAGLIAACVVFVTSFSAETNETSAADPSLQFPDFSDKVLLVYLTRKSEYPNYIMVDSRVHQVGYRPFLFGKCADTHRKEDWKAGLETNISWNDIKSYQSLSPEQYETFLNDTQASR